MIRQKLYIEEYDWIVYIYYAVSCYYAQEIIAKLKHIDCPRRILTITWENMCNDNVNQGFTYSNMDTKESVIVIGLSSSAKEFLNSLTHEIHHLTTHICEYYGIPLNSERACYIAGDTILLMYPKVKTLLCDCCRDTLKN